MSETAESPLAEAMNRLWAKYLPQMEERVATLQQGRRERWPTEHLTQLNSKQAGSDAHKLAGVLGTFGLNEGTELAREAESLYGGSLEGDSSGSRAPGSDCGAACAT